MMKRLMASLVIVFVLILALATPAFAGGGGGGGGVPPKEGVAYKMVSLKETNQDLGRSYLKIYGGYYGTESWYYDPWQGDVYVNDFAYSNPEFRNPQYIGFYSTQITVSYVENWGKPTVKFTYSSPDLGWPDGAVITAKIGTPLWAPFYMNWYQTQ